MKNRKILAVCDLEETYAVHLSDYLSRSGHLPYEVLAFSDPERLVAYALEQPVEVLLITPEALTEPVRALDIRHILLLTDGESPDPEALLPEIDRYQEAGRIARQVLAATGQLRSAGLPEDTQLLGIYSPINRCGKTLFALTLAQHAAESGRVLYLNLEDYSGFEALLRTTFQSDLTDMVHLAQQEASAFAGRLEEQVQSVGSVDFIPPAFFPEDVSAISAQQWEAFLPQVAAALSYRTIVLDIGPHVRDLPSLLQLCTRIYMPLLPDPMSRAKVHQFEKDLEALSLEDLSAEMIRLYLPLAEVHSAGAGLMDDLIYGRMGQFVRRLLKQEKLAGEERTPEQPSEPQSFGWESAQEHSALQMRPLIPGGGNRQELLSQAA